VTALRYSRRVEKADLLRAFRAHLEARLAGLEAEQAAARAGTRVDGSHRPANRGERAAVTSQSYLALGLGQRAASIRDQLAILDRIPPEPRDEVAAGALVTLEDDDGRLLRVLVLPGGEGTVLEAAGGPVTILSPQAPLVRDLIGEDVGAYAIVRRGGREDTVEVIAIA